MPIFVAFRYHSRASVFEEKPDYFSERFPTMSTKKRSF